MKPIISQIIYPINYFKLLLHKKQNFSFNKFHLKLKKGLNIKDNLIFLGRARSGIYLLVKFFLKTTKNKKVALSPYTIPDVINMIIQAGGEPIFLDFKRKETNICINNLKKIIQSKKPSIIIITHYAANEINLRQIVKLCKKFSIKLIEDSALAFNGKSNSCLINHYSDASIFSFSSFKFLNYFFGGALRCKDKKIFNKILVEVNKWKRMKFFEYKEPFINTLKYKIISNNIIFKFFTFFILKKKKKINKNYTSYSINKMDESYFKRPSINCLMELNYKINKLKYYQNHRRKISLVYFKYLKNISIPSNISKSIILNSSCMHYLIYASDPENLRNYLFSQNYHTGRLFYENSAKIKDYRRFFGNTKNIDDLVYHLILLPTHFRISKKYAMNLSKSILKFYDHRCL